MQNGFAKRIAMKKKTNFLKYSLIVLCYFFLFSNSALAAIVPSERYKDGSYTLDDLVGIFPSVAEVYLKLAGSLALLAFVIGGVMMIISGGNKEKVQKGQQALLAGVVGLIIVFTGWLIIQFVYSALGIQWDGSTVFPKAK